MKIRFTKKHTGSYGTFPAGREVDLPPMMLQTIPPDCYESLEPEENRPKTRRRGLRGLSKKSQNE